MIVKQAAGKFQQVTALNMLKELEERFLLAISDLRLDGGVIPSNRPPFCSSLIVASASAQKQK
jgi:hypothetical protein